MRRPITRGHTARALLVLAASGALLAACTVPPSTEGAWRNPSDRITGEVRLPDTSRAWPTAFGPASDGGVLISYLRPDDGDPLTDLTSDVVRIRSDGRVAYRTAAGPLEVHGTASRGGHDVYAGARPRWSASPSDSPQRPLLRRFSASGAPDSTFGGDGLVMLDPPVDPDAGAGLDWWDEHYSSQADDVAIDATGRSYVLVSAILGGAWNTVNRHHWVARLDPNGALDDSYGELGYATLGGTVQINSRDGSDQLLLRDDGSVVVAAEAFGGYGYQPNGSGGLVVGRVGPDGDETAWARAVLPNPGPVDRGCDHLGNIGSTGLLDDGDRVLISVNPGMRGCADPAVVALHDEIVEVPDDGPARPAFDTSFGSGGYASWQLDAQLRSPVQAIGAVVPSGTGGYAVPVLTSTRNPGVVRLNDDGSLRDPNRPGGVRVLREESAGQSRVHYWPSEPTWGTRIATAYSDTSYLLGYRVVDGAPDRLVVVKVRRSSL